MSRTKRETPQMVKAYAYYSGLGEKRTYGIVAKEFGVSETTVNNWARNWGWQERVRKDEESIKSVVLQRVSERVVKDAEEFKTESMMLVDEALEGAKETMRSGKMDFTRPADVVNLIKTGLLLRGEATDRRETVQKKAAEGARRILDLIRRGGGDPLANGPGGAIPVFAVADEGGNEGSDSECS